MATNSFKSTRRVQRQVTTEETYGKGMQYTNAPLLEGFCKSLINYDLKDLGEVLTPRAGYQLLHSANVGAPTYNPHIHHIGQATITNTVTLEDISRRYVFNDCVDTNGEYFDFLNATTLLEGSFSPEFDNPNHFFFNVPHQVTSPKNYLVKRKTRVKPQLLHDVNLTPHDVFTATPHLPVVAHINGIPILPVKYTPDTAAPTVYKNGFAKMLLKTDGSGGFTNSLEFVTPKEPSPTEAINYGYNMLKDYPYSFVDTLSAAVGTGLIQMQGILPYTDDTCTVLKFNAHVGERITFRLFADFANYTDTFKFRWEIRELGSEEVTVYEDQQKTSNTYRLYDSATDYAIDVTHSTDFIRLTIKPPYKQFSVTVTAYSTADLTEPVQVMTLGSYSLTKDSAGSTQNIAPKTYPLHTASDMCAWRQRVVLWGVQGAPNMVFLSDINDPSYFPYPNNCEIYDEEVISCMPYLDALLVFTETKLYRLNLGADGLTFSTSMVQDKLSLSPFDRETITLVQNMVYFKNGNYFYMVVPRTSSAQPGALQMAPISTPITYMLDHFSKEVKDNIFMLYNPYDSRKFPHLGPGEEYDLRLQDYYNYLDTYVIRNVYKYEIVVRDKTTKQVTSVLLELDYVMNYDTTARTWTTYVYQSNPGRMLPYRQTVTDATIYAQIRRLGADSYVDFIKPRSLVPEDTFPLEQNFTAKNRILRNHQMLDTGYRNQNIPVKKRYREIQFRIGMYNQHSLEFGTEFIVDEQIRKDLFEYAVTQVTDETAQDYGYIYVQRNFADPEVAVGAAILGDEDISDDLYLPAQEVVSNDTIVLQSSGWVLDASQLANVVSSKVRFMVSGKGYSPRFILVSFNDVTYELTAHAWVYRTMNAR